MIPKIIHYCWFGRGEIPESAIKCIESWKKFLPDYEIKLWNEDNFDVNSCTYTSQAYKSKKYAFVSDYARLKILNEYGGLYFDTDVELIRPIDDIIVNGAFMGCERSASKASTPESLGVNPGVGLGSEKNNKVLSSILGYYDNLSFLDEEGKPNTRITIVTITSKVLTEFGLSLTDNIQQCEDMTIYPHDYFSPKDIDTKQLSITYNTRSIHHFDASWAEWYDKAAGERGPKLKRILGNKIGQSVNITIYVFQKYGFRGILKKLFKR